eukprot:COSAG06_NODE_1685_length_8718_cov_7.598561_6_plen_91_part_00
MQLYPLLFSIAYAPYLSKSECAEIDLPCAPTHTRAHSPIHSLVSSHCFQRRSLATQSHVESGSDPATETDETRGPSIVGGRVLRKRRSAP